MSQLFYWKRTETRKASVKDKKQPYVIFTKVCIIELVDYRGVSEIPQKKDPILYKRLELYIIKGYYLVIAVSSS